jgi:hypothetical protein
MEKIEFTATVKFGDTVIDEIKVMPLTFAEMGKLWRQAGNAKSRAEVALQRSRIMHQTHFMAAGKRVLPNEAQLSQLPASVAKAIIPALDNGQGVAGKLLNDGDGATSPILYQLGSPIGMKNGKGEDVSITELEFMASTYGEIEDVLCAENDIAKTLELFKRIAKPVGGSLQTLPGWALDKITTADGVTVMNLILSRF